MVRWTMIGGTMLVMSMGSTSAHAHCQVPCGIYDDPARVAQLREHTETIRKAVRLIGKLAAKDDAQSRNQLVRWVTVKEQHADKVIRTVADYFLAQKIKPLVSQNRGHAAYLWKVAKHHAVIVAAMKCKQTVDMSNVEALGRAVGAIASYWRK